MLTDSKEFEKNFLRKFFEFKNYEERNCIQMIQNTKVYLNQFYRRLIQSQKSQKKTILDFFLIFEHDDVRLA